MKPHHPIVELWRQEHAKKRSECRVLPVITPLGHRRHRILSEIFYTVEQHGVTPKSAKFDEFHFEYLGIATKCALVQAIDADSSTEKRIRKLTFVIVDPKYKDSECFALWSDDDGLLETKIPEIVDGILAACRIIARFYRSFQKTKLERELLSLLDQISGLEEAPGTDRALSVDPGTFHNLVSLAEAHRQAVLVRRLVRHISSNIPDPSEVVAGRRLDEWIAWAYSRADEFDPANQGAAYVFKKIRKLC